MRLPATTLALAALLALAGCGDEEPDQIDAGAPRPAPQRPAVDTTIGDTGGPAAGAPGAERAGEAAAAAADGAARAPGQARRAGQAGQAERAGQADAAAGADPATGGAAGPEAVRRGQRLYTVQVAAFTSPDSATKWTGRLSSLDLPAWTSMAELGGETYYRVRVGAVPSLDEARRLGGMLSQRFEWPVWVAPVTPSERIPEDAVSRTRRVLGER